MAKMKMAEIQKEVKTAAFEEIKSFFAEKGEQYGDFEIAIPVEIEGEGEFWAKVSVVCGKFKDSKTSKAFDPFEAREDWEAEKKAKAKADKIARSKKK